ncbi:sce7725 family protein, partial [Yersinia aleksiciae]|uniref:sce7725 family protein n=1 Tax=Yersinia aleksiciae TaxID=263819 RepID=UPI0011A7BD55
MYYCYLRGKQYELLAVRSCINKIAQKNITTVIEPVRDSSRDLYSCLRDSSQNNTRIILVANPKCGDLKNNQLALDNLIQGAILTNPTLELGFIVDDTTSLLQLTSFISTYPNNTISIIHYGSFNNAAALLQLQTNHNLFRDNIFIDGRCSHHYISTFNQTRKILIRDGFNRTINNAGYASNIVEFFSDLYSNYSSLGFHGFGDFSTVGDHFAEGGGQAITAALHITYDNVESPEVLIHHFLSDPRTIADDVAILIDEALEKLEDFITNNRPDILNWSTACSELISIYRTPGNTTNLAYLKKMSIKNHFE